VQPPGYIERIKVTGFRCVQEAELRLTRLHALIGPNDSGKSSLLRAIADDVNISGRAELAFISYPTDPKDPPRLPSRPVLGRDHSSYLDGTYTPPPNLMRPVLRLDPDELRKDVPLYVHGSALWFHNEKGLGLAGLYDALLSRDRRAFASLEDRFRELFPTVAAIRLDNTALQTKALGLTLSNGAVVSTRAMSEGMLYWLAFAIIEHLHDVEMLLIEEPENGLHPSRIGEVMRVLRNLSQRTQIILATHSPLVINELTAEEVTIVTRSPARGTICTAMTQTKHFEARAKVYALGELWLSYADGNFESELVPIPADSPSIDSSPASEK
jgi:predicted ATPase